MTRHQKKITHKQQVMWWLKFLRPGKYYAWLVYSQGNPIGYGLIDPSKPWISGGLISSQRGKGFGKELFQFLTDTAHCYSDEVWLEVWSWNKKALKLYENLGFRPTIKGRWQDKEHPDGMTHVDQLRMVHYV